MGKGGQGPATASLTPLPPVLPSPLAALQITLTTSSLPISQQQLQVKLEGLISCSFHPGLTD